MFEVRFNLESPFDFEQLERAINNACALSNKAFGPGVQAALLKQPCTCGCGTANFDGKQYHYGFTVRDAHFDEPLELLLWWPRNVAHTERGLLAVSVDGAPHDPEDAVFIGELPEGVSRRSSFYIWLLSLTNYIAGSIAGGLRAATQLADQLG